jgi:tripartite-type tricarboxylate transporter receptor subunit TctC
MRITLFSKPLALNEGDKKMVRFSKLLVSATLALASSVAMAFPEKPIVMVVPYAAGGSTDVLARILAEAMSRDLGQQVVVENAGGGGGTIGTTKVVRARNDGHTILLHNMGIATAPALYDNLGFDPLTDLEPVALTGDVPMILVRNKNFAPSSIPDLIKHMKDNPGAVNLSHAGVGATSYLCALLFTQTAKVKATLVPYRGTGPALQDLVAGNVDLICDQPVATGPHIKAGSLKPYAMATAERISIMPEVPTFKEQGLDNFELSVWHGIYAPKDTPKEAIDRLNKSIRTALSEPALIKRFQDMGVMIPKEARLQPRALGEHLKAEIQRWNPVIKAAGAKAG